VIGGSQTNLKIQYILFKKLKGWKFLSNRRQVPMGESRFMSST